MKIGIEASRANKPVKTGVEWYAYQIIEGLKKLDSRNQYELYTNEPLNKELGNCPANFKEVRLDWPPKYLWTQIRLAWSMRKLKPDVLFFPAHVMPTYCPIKKTVVTIHDVGFREKPELYKTIQKIYHLYATAVTVKKAAKIIVPSFFTKDALLKYYPDAAGKVKVIYHGFNPSFLTSGRSDFIRLKNQYRLSDEYFIYIGRLEKKKNILGLLRAFASALQRRPGIKLVLVGAAGHGFDEIQEFITNNQLVDEVIITGWLPTITVASLLHHAVALIFPSFYEGFGLPALEAQAAGVPVLLSRAGSLPEIAGDAALYFDPYNPEEMTETMLQILSDRQLVASLKAKGLVNANRFSWTTAVKETWGVLVAS